MGAGAGRRIGWSATSWRPPGRLRLVIAVLGAVVIAATVASPGVARATTASTKTAPAGAASSRSRARRTIEAAPRIPAKAKKLSALPATTSLRLDVLLKPADPDGLAGYAQAVSTPGSVAFHRYLTTAQFASRFGPSPGALATVRSALRAGGLPAGRLSPDHLSIRLRASASRLSRAFATGFSRFRLRSGRAAYANTRAPSLPAGAALEVEGVVGLDNLTEEQPGAVHVKAPRTHRHGQPAVTPQVVTGGPQPCAAAGTGGSAGSYTADQVAAAYGFPSLYGQGDLGQGQTVAVIEGEPDLASDVAAYQACYGTHATVSYVGVDGGAGTGAGSGEAALDIEQIIGLAPEAHIDVYQSYPFVLTLYDEFADAISSDTAKVISTSWGVCESLATQYPDPTFGYGPTYAAAFQAENTLFQEAAVQGQSIVAAAGDSGSEGCDPYQAAYAGFTSELSVQDPSAQPYVTGVGGTTLADPGAPSSETVWNSYGAGGGGISQTWTMPSYQSEAPPGLGVVNADSSPAPCGAVAGDCRQVPDVSADADPYTGYAVYWNGSWWSIGGTSAGAPLWSALLSLTNASSACASSPVGFANPALYAAAAADPGAFNDITVGNNDYTRTNDGLYPARPGYDMATGLGSPTTNLPAALCAAANPPPVRITSASSELVGVGATGSFTVAASGSPSPTIAETGSLPSGMAFGSNGDGTATLSGTPTRSGVYPLVLTATNGSSTATQSFVLQVGTAPVISSAPTATFRAGAKGSFQVAASGTPTPSVSLQGGTLPSGLILSSTGKLAGTPAASATGTYTLTVQAADGVEPAATQALTVVVDGAPSFTSSATAGFAVGARGAFTVSTSAVPVATLTESGALMPGLAFAATGGGHAVIAGAPTQAGVFSVAIRATNADGTTVQTLVVDIAARTVAPVFTSPAQTQFVVAVWRTFQFRTTGVPAPTFSIVSGSLPMQPGSPSVTLSSSGLLSGWPYWGSGGVYRFQVEATNGSGPPVFQNFTLTVAQASGVSVEPGTYPTSSPTASGDTELAADLVLGQPALLTLQARGVPTGTPSESGNLPPGMAFTETGGGTATISGTPSAAGTFYSYLAGENSIGGASILFAVSVAPAVSPSIVSPPDTTILQGTSTDPWCLQVAAAGFPAPDLTETGALPEGWGFGSTANSGSLEPNAAFLCNAGSPDSIHITLSASNSAGQATQAMNLSVGVPGQTPFHGPTSIVFQPGVYHAVYLGATPDCGYSLLSPEKLFQGVTLSTSGLLSGVVSPGWGGTDALTMYCLNGARPYHASEPFTISVPGAGAPPPLPSPPVVKGAPEIAPPPSYNQIFPLKITTTVLPLAVDHVSYQAGLQATGAYGQFKWYVTGHLPPGLKLGRLTGTIQGRPRSSDSGVYTFTVQVRAKVKEFLHRPAVTISASAVLSITTVATSSNGTARSDVHRGRTRSR